MKWFRVIIKGIVIIILFVGIIRYSQIIDIKINHLANKIESSRVEASVNQDINLQNDFYLAQGIRALMQNLNNIEFDLNILKEPKPQFDVDKAYNSVVRILIGEGLGSGTVIKKTDKEIYILTCYHVVSDTVENDALLGTKSFVTVEYFKDGTNNTDLIAGAVSYKAYVEKYSKELDLAIIKINGVDDNLTVTTVAQEDPSLGETVYTIGNPLGAYRYVSKGILSSKLIELNYYAVDSLTTYGNSGGATFNENNELIGVPSKVPTYLGMIPESNMGMIVSTPTIREFTKELFSE